MNRTSANTLANRLGLSCHDSPLRFKIRRFLEENREGDIEQWLVQVANARDAKIVTNPPPPEFKYLVPTLSEFSNEELVCALIQPNCQDYPQILRLAGQIISRGDVEVSKLVTICVRERSSRVLAEITRQALKVNPDHEIWRSLAKETENEKELSEPIIHWTRLAEPIMEFGKPNAQGWRLVA